MVRQSGTAFVSRILICSLIAALLFPAFAFAQELDTDIVFEDLEGEPIEVGEATDGEIDGDNPIVAYTFEAEAGTGYTAYVADDSFQSGFLTISNEDGDVIAHSDDDPFGIDFASRIPLFFVPEDGTYTVSVTTSGYWYLSETDDETSFELTVEEAEYEMLSLGESASGEFEGEGSHVALFAVEVEQGDIPQIVVETTGSNVLVESVFDPTFDARRSNTPVGTTDQYISPFYVFDNDVLVVGVYYDSFLGDFSDEFTVRAENYEPIAVEAGETISVPLSIETISNFVTFEAQDEEEVTITVDAPEAMDAQLALFDPDGRVIAVESAADGINGLELQEDGQYILQVFPGGFMIELSQLGELELTLEIEQ